MSHDATERSQSDRSGKVLRMLELAAAVLVAAAAIGKLWSFSSFARSLVGLAGPDRTPIAALLVGLELLAAATLLAAPRRGVRGFVLLSWSALLLGARLVLPMPRTCDCLGLDLPSAVSAALLGLFSVLGAVDLVATRSPWRRKVLPLAIALAFGGLGSGAATLMASAPGGYRLVSIDPVQRVPGTYRVELRTAEGDRVTTPVLSAESSCPCVEVTRIRGAEISLAVRSQVPGNVTPYLRIELGPRESSVSIETPLPLEPRNRRRPSR